MVIPPPRRRAARSAARAAYRIGGESERVTESLSAAKRCDLKDKGRGFPRPLIPHVQLRLGAGSGYDVRAGAVLVPDLAAVGAVDAVGDRGRPEDRQLGRDIRRVISLQ